MTDSDQSSRICSPVQTYPAMFFNSDINTSQPPLKKDKDGSPGSVVLRFFKLIARINSIPDGATISTCIASIACAMEAQLLIRVN